MKKSIGAKTIVYTAPVFVVGTYDKAGRPNAMTAAWGGTCCSKPPCIAISLRKATYTYSSIMEQKAFTINVPSESYAVKADYFGIVSGRDRDKFKDTGLTPVKSNIVNAPYIKEFPFVLECKLLNVVEIGLHTQFIGEIMDIKVEDSFLGSDGMPDMEKIKPFMFDPARGMYYGIGTYIGKAFSIGKEHGK